MAWVPATLGCFGDARGVSGKHPGQLSLDRGVRGGNSYYDYDADSKRVSQRTADGFRQFVYQGPDMLKLQLERDESEETVAHYTMGAGLEAMRRETSSFYHYNHLGTALALTGADEAVSDTYRHDAWGVLLERTGSTVNPHTYVGRERYYRMPSAAMYHLGFRDYAQGLGRFMTVDPALFVGVEDVLEFGQLRGYMYVKARPTAKLDANGQIPPIVVGGVVLTGLAAYTARCMLDVALPPAERHHDAGLDKLGHCVFHCHFARCMFPITGPIGMAVCAWEVGVVHELWQKLAEEGKYDPEDIDANETGIVTAYYFWEDCEDGCRARLPSLD